MEKRPFLNELIKDIGNLWDRYDGVNADSFIDAIYINACAFAYPTAKEIYTLNETSALGKVLGTTGLAAQAWFYYHHPKYILVLGATNLASHVYEKIRNARQKRE